MMQLILDLVLFGHGKRETQFRVGEYDCGKAWAVIVMTDIIVQILENSLLHGVQVMRNTFYVFLAVFAKSYAWYVFLAMI